MAWVAVGTAAFQLISGAQQAELVRNGAVLTKSVADANAKFAEVDAWKAEQDGYSQEARYQTQIDQTIGDQKVAFAAKGVDSSQGTAADLIAETKITGILNKMDIRNQAHATALGYKNQAYNYRMQGITGQQQANYNASAIENSSQLNALSTLAPKIGSSLTGYYKSKPTTSPNAGRPG